MFPERTLTMKQFRPEQIVKKLRQADVLPVWAIAAFLGYVY